MEERHPALDLVDAFGSFDRVRLSHLDAAARANQLAARQVLYDYVEALWQDVDRSGERPSVGEKYRAIAVMQEFIRELRLVAFEAVYDDGNEGER